VISARCGISFLWPFCFLVVQHQNTQLRLKKSEFPLRLPSPLTRLSNEYRTNWTMSNLTLSLNGVDRGYRATVLINPNHVGSTLEKIGNEEGVESIRLVSD
jgi:hypothetical protein